MEQDEIECLLTTASDQFCPILITALHSGMRRGELLNLKWSEVDFRNHIIVVRESKSGKSRKIPMNDTLHETLSVVDHEKVKLFEHAPSEVSAG